MHNRTIMITITIIHAKSVTNKLVMRIWEDIELLYALANLTRYYTHKNKVSGYSFHSICVIFIIKDTIVLAHVVSIHISIDVTYMIRVVIEVV